MDVENINIAVVIGAGIMGQGIAQNFAQAGLTVKIIDIDNGKLEECRRQINLNLKLFQEFNLLKDDIPQIVSRISYYLMKELDDVVKDTEFVIEAIPEVLSLKSQLFKQLDSSVDSAILASNTSSFTIAALSEGCRNADRIIGVHYFNPAHIMPLVEIHYGPATSQKVIDVTKALMLKVGKKPIILKKELPGFLVNRIQAAMGREILHLLQQDIVTPEDMDIASKASYGFRYACIGSVEALDMIGIDTLLTVNRNLFKHIDSSTAEPDILVGMVNKGDLGVKSGKGFYNYEGKTKEQVLEEQNRKLLQQLTLFNKMEPSGH